MPCAVGAQPVGQMAEGTPFFALLLALQGFVQINRGNWPNSALHPLLGVFL